MNKISKRLLSVLLCLGLLFGTSAMSVNAEDEAVNEVTRVSCSFNGDAKTSRGFCWYTKNNCKSRVEVVKTSEFNGSFDNADSFVTGDAYKFRKEYCHKVVADGLEPGTEYTYRVGDGTTWSENGTFRTDDGDNKFSFVTIADVQASSDENFAHAAETMKGALKVCPNAEFMVNLGDFVNKDTNEEWDWYFKNFAFANMNLTIAPVAGNHDGNITNKLNINVFNSMFNLSNPNTDSSTNWVNGVYYSYDYGNAHFIVINSNDMYPMTQSQRNWIINDVNSSDADWNIVLMHRASYSVGKNINKPDTVIMRDILLPLFDELGIDLVYAGHDHTYYRSYQVKGDKVVDDVKYITESYNGEQTTFAVNPDGTVHINPSTAGTKRYAVNDKAIDPIGECAAVKLSTKDMGGCFTTTVIDNDKLIVKSYIVDDDTQEISLIDKYAIKKTVGQNTVDPDYEKLPTDNASNVSAFVKNFIAATVDFVVKYLFVLVPQLIKGAIKK